MKVYFVLLVIILGLVPNIFSQVQFIAHTITTDADGARSVYAVDIDNDGDIDVLSASSNDNKIAWYENDGNENFTIHIIATNVLWAWSVYAADVDGDGDIDVLSAAGDGPFPSGEIAWFENDGNESFTPHIIATDARSATAVYAVDVDSDGDIDVLSASGGWNTIVWYENDSNENFIPHAITTFIFDAISVYAVDVDGDADIDILSASDFGDKIAWHENDGNEVFTTHTVQTLVMGARSVHAVDLDEDGDIDVLSASSISFNSRIAWYENDGNESFTSHTISFDVDGANSVYAIDVDGDGDLDVLSASQNDNKVAWYTNDGNEIFTSHIISTEAFFATSVYAADIDGDGDIDVLSASSNDDKIAWYENLLIVSINGNDLNNSPNKFSLIQNYPNPFNPTTKIKYTVAETGFVTLKIYDVLGNEVATLVNEEKPAGSYEVEFQSTVGNRQLASGVYYYQLRAGDYVETKKMIFLT